MTLPGAIEVGGLCVAAKESRVAGRELDVAVGGVNSLAAQRSTLLGVRAMSRTAICDDHDMELVIYL